MPGYEQVSDFNAASGADEEEREKRAKPGYCMEWCQTPEECRDAGECLDVPQDAGDLA